MRIAGFNPNSFVDYPGNISAVIFFGGCNFDCWYCHNKWLLDVEKLYNIDEILKRISAKKDFLDGVVISGGEPTLANIDDLLWLAKEIKSLGLKLKLDTNGTNFEKMKMLMPYLDYVAMDIKAPLSKYREITCADDKELLSIKNSIAFLKENEIDSEFRTTFVPTLNTEDILEIAHTLKGCKHYYLQQYVPIEGQNIPSHSPKYISKVLEQVREILPCEVRGL